MSWLKRTIKRKLDDLQGVLQSVVEFHNCGLVSTAVAVVWRAADSHNVAVVAPIITLFWEKGGFLSKCNTPHVHASLSKPTTPHRSDTGSLDGGEPHRKGHLPPWPAGGLWRPELGHWRGWRSPRCPVRRCSRRPGERCPSHRGRRGPTTEGHTWDPGVGQESTGY